MAIKSAVTMPTTDREWQNWCRQSHDLRVRFGTGSPAGVIIADIGTLYCRTDGSAGATLYVKESGNGLSSGWAAK